MASVTSRTSSHAVIAQGSVPGVKPERRPHAPYRSALSMLDCYTDHAGAQLQPADKTKLDKAKEELRALYQRPSTGRTTAQGRRVEKPGSDKQGGPSGQTDASKHDRRHTNK